MKKAILAAILLLLLTLLSCREAEQEMYTVTLNHAAYSHTETVAVAPGGTLEPPRTYNNNGYTSLGWYISENGTWRAWDFSHDTVQGNITLTEKQEPRRFVICLDYKDGTSRQEEVPVTYGESYTLPEPSREGYIFCGWYRSIYAAKATALQGTYEETSNLNLYAHWSKLPPETCVSFGAYECDNDPGNGTEPIEWWVIDKRADGSAYLVVSRYLLDWRAFGPERGTQDDIPVFLGEEFYSMAFTDAEKAAILPTYLADVNQTQRVFSLNEEEVALMPHLTQRAGFLTAYATAQRGQQNVGSILEFGEHVSYEFFLRGKPRDIYKCYTHTGTKSIPSHSERRAAGIRPAMWMDATFIEALMGE